MEKFEVSDGPLYGWYEDGREILIRFMYVNYDVPQMTLISSPSNPIVGNQVWFNSTTWIPYSSQNLFYEPVPFDFLYTAETQPQVIVSVNGIEAICSKLNCNYNYVAANASITGFSLSGTTLTITGQ